MPSPGGGNHPRSHLPALGSRSGSGQVERLSLLLGYPFIQMRRLRPREVRHLSWEETELAPDQAKVGSPRRHLTAACTEPGEQGTASREEAAAIKP